MDAFWKDIADRLKSVGYGLVDMGVAWLGTWLLGFFNRPDILVVGDDPTVPAANLAPFALFFLSKFGRKFLPIILKKLLEEMGVKFAGVMLAIALAVAGGGMVSAAEIVGPDTIQPYRFGKFDAKGSEKSTYLWRVTPSAKVDIDCDQYGDHMTFVGPPGAYVIELEEIGPSGNDKRPIIASRTIKTVNVGEPTPGPVDPVDPVTPPLPAGKYGLAKFAFTNAATLPPADCQRAAKMFRDQAGTSTYKTPSDLTKGTKVGLESLGPAWAAWRAALSAELTRLGLPKTTNTLADFQVAWLEIATGLEARK